MTTENDTEHGSDKLSQTYVHVSNPPNVFCYRNDIVLTPFCNETEWEEKVKTLSRAEALKEGEVELETTATSVAAKTLCIPLEQVRDGINRMKWDSWDTISWVLQ